MQGRCTVLIDDPMWRVVSVNAESVSVRQVPVDSAMTLADKADAAAALIDELAGGGPIVLALASRDCLSTSVLTDGLGRSGRRQSMGYLLEEHLPISAEDSVADYVEQQGVALGVCAELGLLQPLVGALEDAGVRVRHICPAALLVGQQMVQAGQADALLIAGDDAVPCDLIELSGQSPCRWWWLTDEQSRRDHLQSLAERSGDQSSAAVVMTLGNTGSVERVQQVASDGLAWGEAAGRIGARMLAGEVSPWIDLRRDALAAPEAGALYQKQVGRLVSALVLLLLCLIGAMYWRGMNYEQEAKRLYGEQVMVFKDTFKDRSVSRGSVLIRMRGELKRLEGVGGQARLRTPENHDALNPTSALTHLYHVLTALPPGLRYQVSDISIEPKLIRFDGAAESALVAERVAGAVRATGLYDVDPTNTRALHQFGVSFGLVARPKDRPREDTR